MIRVENLTKTYKTIVGRKGLRGAIRTLISPNHRYVEAVRDISFAIAPGEMVGFIGPNGAGKSTTIKMLTGVLVPTSGSVQVNGVDPHTQRMQNAQQIGAVFGQRSQLWYDLPLSESFSLLRRIYQVPPDSFHRTLNRFEEMLELGEFIHQPVRQLSLGQRMRGEIAAALLHSPKVVFLDEPTIGLDVQAKLRIRDFLKSINAELGVTILLTTHDMSDIQELCSRVMIIDKGCLVYDGSLGAIQRRFGSQRTIVFELADDPPCSPEDLFVGHSLQSTLETAAVDLIDRQLSVRFNREVVTAPTVIDAVLKKCEMIDIRVDETPIDTVIASIYEEGIA